MYRCYGKEITGENDIMDIDETKLLIDISRTNYTGYELEKILGRQYGKKRRKNSIKSAKK